MTLRISVFLFLLCLVFSIRAQQAPPIPGLVGYWPLGENGNDTSGGGRNGTVFEASPATDRHNNPAGAYQFDGTNDRITLSSDIVLNLEQGFTISTWHKIETGAKTSWSAYIGKTLSEGGQMMFHSGGSVTYYQDFNDPTYYIWASGVNLGDEIPYDEWFHLSIVVHKTGTDYVNVKIYVNGEFKKQHDMLETPDHDIFTVRYLGRVQNRYYEGMLDDVAVFDQALGSSQIRDLYHYDPSNATWLTNSNGLYINSGNVAIGTSDTRVDGTTYKLAVDGSISAKEITITAENWPDYVFATDYHLETLEEIEAFIKANHHLPGVPSSSEVDARGAQLGEMNTILLRKIEELTLHMIEMNKEVGALKAANDALKQEIDKIKKE